MLRKFWRDEIGRDKSRPYARLFVGAQFKIGVGAQFIAPEEA
jgi:hypothetical protein